MKDVFELTWVLKISQNSANVNLSCLTFDSYTCPLANAWLQCMWIVFRCWVNFLPVHSENVGQQFVIDFLLCFVNSILLFFGSFLD